MKDEKENCEIFAVERENVYHRLLHKQNLALLLQDSFVIDIDFVIGTVLYLSEAKRLTMSYVVNGVFYITFI